MKNDKIKKEIYAYILLIVGSALFAVGDVMFVNPYHLAPGGTYGLSNVFHTVHPWRISYYALCMDIPLLLIGTWILGPMFGVKTVVSTLLINAFTWVLEHTWGYGPVVKIGDVIKSATPIDGMINIPDSASWFSPDYVTNTLVAGVIYGISIGLIFKSGATSGGSDIISMIIHKYTKISLGTLVIIVDSCITLSTLFIAQEIRLPLYSIIVIIIEGKIIDMVVDGTKSYKTVQITTQHATDVATFITGQLHRRIASQTPTEGNNNTLSTISTVMDRTELSKLKTYLHANAPESDLNILNSTEVYGEGFKALPKE